MILQKEPKSTNKAMTVRSRNYVMTSKFAELKSQQNPSLANMQLAINPLNIYSELVRNVEIRNGLTDSDLKHTALSAAKRSYSPYSRCPSGVALVDFEGKVYRGWYMESAAYNPSLGPVQAALVDFVANGGGGGFERIVGAVLVEKKDAVVRQEHTARMLFQTIAPKCDFKVFHCYEY